MFQEMSVTTGGASATNPTAGRAVEHAVQERREPRVRGSAFLRRRRELQSTNLPDELLPLPGPSGKGNRMKELTDVGFDLGGPICPRSVVGWGSYGRTDGTCSRSTAIPMPPSSKTFAFQDSAQLTKTIAGVSLLPRQQGEERPRRQPAAARRDTWDQPAPVPLYKGQVNIAPATTCS
jgi:hypothetical protein